MDFAPAALSQPDTNAKNRAIPTITGHAMSHQRRNRCARPTSSTIAAMAETASGPSVDHWAPSHAATSKGPRPQ